MILEVGNKNGFVGTFVRCELDGLLKFIAEEYQSLYYVFESRKLSDDVAQDIKHDMIHIVQQEEYLSKIGPTFLELANRELEYCDVDVLKSILISAIYALSGKKLLKLYKKAMYLRLTTEENPHGTA